MAAIETRHPVSYEHLRLEPVEGGTWSFYDSYVAFPHTRFRPTERDEVAEIQIGLDADGGGTLGEFGVRFYRFGGPQDRKVYARIEAFADGSDALTKSHVAPLLAALRQEDEDITPERLMEGLRRIGFKDRTQELKGNWTPRCPVCDSADTDTDKWKRPN